MNLPEPDENWTIQQLQCVYSQRQPRQTAYPIGELIERVYSRRARRAVDRSLPALEAVRSALPADLAQRVSIGCESTGRVVIHCQDDDSFLVCQAAKADLLAAIKAVTPLRTPRLLILPR